MRNITSSFMRVFGGNWFLKICPQTVYSSNIEPTYRKSEPCSRIYGIPMNLKAFSRARLVPTAEGSGRDCVLVCRIVKWPIAIGFTP